MSYAQRFISSRLRSKAIFITPDDLIKAVANYFQWCEDNPLAEEQATVYQGIVTRYDMDKVRPFTKAGLASYLGITVAKLNSYRRKDEGWAEALDLIDQVIYTQKFEHASVGLMNANLISRDLGLADKKELTGNNGGPLQQVVQYQLPDNNRSNVE